MNSFSNSPDIIKQLISCKDQSKTIGKLEIKVQFIESLGCRLAVKIPGNHSNSFRRYAFGDDGVVLIFDSWGPTGSKHTGSQRIQFFPFGQTPIYFQEKNLVYVRSGNENVVFVFDSTKGRLIQLGSKVQKKSDKRIEEGAQTATDDVLDPVAEFKNSLKAYDFSSDFKLMGLPTEDLIKDQIDKGNGEINRSRLEIKSLKSLRIDSGFKIGGDPTSIGDRNSSLSNSKDQICELKNRQLFLIQGYDSSFRFLGPKNELNVKDFRHYIVGTEAQPGKCKTSFFWDL